jgi:hypothetical protein
LTKQTDFFDVILRRGQPDEWHGKPHEVTNPDQVDLHVAVDHGQRTSWIDEFAPNARRRLVRDVLAHAKPNGRFAMPIPGSDLEKEISVAHLRSEDPNTPVVFVWSFHD